MPGNAITYLECISFCKKSIHLSERWFVSPRNDPRCPEDHSYDVGITAPNMINNFPGIDNSTGNDMQFPVTIHLHRESRSDRFQVITGSGFNTHDMVLNADQSAWLEHRAPHAAVLIPPVEGGAGGGAAVQLADDALGLAVVQRRARRAALGGGLGPLLHLPVQ
eukprot:gene11382-biopygen13699